MEMEGSIEAASNGARENPYTVLETSLLEELDRLAPKTTGLNFTSRCIHRVPPPLRLVCEKAYTPQLVSLGPLHHGKQALKGMEEQKMRYLRYFLGRTNNLSLMHYIEKVKDREAELRSCYSETIELESDEFVKIILVDAIFIIEFLFRYCYFGLLAESPQLLEESYRSQLLEEISQLLEESDCIFGSSGLLNHVQFDFLLVENQLPFFILEDLFDPDIFPFPSNYPHRLGDVESISIICLSHFVLAKTVVSSIGETCSVPNLETICCSQLNIKHFVDLVTRFYVAPLLKPEASLEKPEASLETICCSQVKVKHFVDLLRRFFVAPLLKPEATGQPIALSAPSLEELHQAGVQFKAGHSSNSLFDIKFKDGILEIPKLKVVDETGTVLRNLVAFEQCNMGGQTSMSDYVFMMDNLVNTPKDVGLLVEYGIVTNWLGGGNDELSTLINSLATGVCISSEEFYYGSLFQDLNEYCSSPWHRRMANLRQNYFNTPWKTISFIAAVLLLVLTTIQTICSIISLKP